jgi:D-alanine--poly(phosphoribitol) ligase subunit 2
MSRADQILAIIAKVVDSEEVVSNPDLLLYDASLLDSLKTVELMVSLSEEFRVELSPAEFERQQWATPRKIVAYLQQKMAA